MPTSTIRETTLREMTAAGAVSGISATGRTGGFVVAVRCGRNQNLLASTRGSVRIFPNLTTLAAYLSRLGISEFAVNTQHYCQARVRKARPDRALALRRTRALTGQPDFFKGEI